MKKSIVFPWSEQLPQGDLETMYADIAACAKAYYSEQTTMDFAEKLETLLSDWKTVAEAHTDPEVVKIPMSPVAPGDLGDAPRPAGVMQPQGRCNASCPRGEADENWYRCTQAVGHPGPHFEDDPNLSWVDGEIVEVWSMAMVKAVPHHAHCFEWGDENECMHEGCSLAWGEYRVQVSAWKGPGPVLMEADEVAHVSRMESAAEAGKTACLTCFHDEERHTHSLPEEGYRAYCTMCPDEAEFHEFEYLAPPKTEPVKIPEGGGPTYEERVRHSLESNPDENLAVPVHEGDFYVSEDHPHRQYALPRKDIESLLDDHAKDTSGIAELSEAYRTLSREKKGLIKYKDQAERSEKLIKGMRMQGARHHFVFACDRYVEEAGRRLQFCRDCEKDRDHPAHFFSKARYLDSRTVEEDARKALGRLVESVKEGRVRIDSGSVQRLADELFEEILGVKEGVPVPGTKVRVKVPRDGSLLGKTGVIDSFTHEGGFLVKFDSDSATLFEVAE